MNENYMEVSPKDLYQSVLKSSRPSNLYIWVDEDLLIMDFIDHFIKTKVDYKNRNYLKESYDIILDSDVIRSDRSNAFAFLAVLNWIEANDILFCVDQPSIYQTSQYCWRIYVFHEKIWKNKKETILTIRGLGSSFWRMMHHKTYKGAKI